MNAAFLLMPALVVLGVAAAFRRTRVSLPYRWLAGMGAAAVSLPIGALVVFYISAILFHDAP
jgi:hypothetical protein